MWLPHVGLSTPTKTNQAVKKGGRAAEMHKLWTTDTFNPQIKLKITTLVCWLFNVTYFYSALGSLSYKTKDVCWLKTKTKQD